MLSPAKVLYISDYDFGAAHDLRHKYVVVLHNFEGKSVLVSLTTSQCHIPDIIKANGCIKHDDRMIHSYYFPANEILSGCGFFFELDTFIDINSSQVFEKDVQHITTKYIDSGKTQEKCTLNEKYYFDLLYCISKSKFVAKKTKIILEPIMQTLYNKLHGSNI